MNPCFATRIQATYLQPHSPGRCQDDERPTPRSQSHRNGIIHCRHRSLKHPGRAQGKQQAATDSVPAAIRPYQQAVGDADRQHYTEGLRVVATSFCAAYISLTSAAAVHHRPAVAPATTTTVANYHRCMVKTTSVRQPNMPALLATVVVNTMHIAVALL